MKAYLATTGILFILLVVAHVMRALQEPHLARDPWFVMTSVISLVLAGWAFRLIKSKQPPR